MSPSTIGWAFSWLLAYWTSMVWPTVPQWVGLLYSKNWYGLHYDVSTIKNPCEESLDYNFQNCIYTKMISKIGCQPYWLDYINTDVANCSNASHLDDSLQKMGDLIQISTEKELTDEYKCLKPCNYMEYKVNMTVIILRLSERSSNTLSCSTRQIVPPKNTLCWRLLYQNKG